MKKATQHSRWHCFNISTDAKMIRRFPVDETQPKQHNADFTPWVRGTGPHSDEALAKILYNNRKHFKGVPKSENQKEKLRQAHLGNKFTAEHRKKLSESWKTKREIKRLRIIEAFKIASEVAEAHYNTND
mgnify:FL=1|tara:strand:+ start:80 stop:469 length:390 start_codon:yes stop_codon:yes gene_type:complete